MSQTNETWTTKEGDDMRVKKVTVTYWNSEWVRPAYKPPQRFEFCRLFLLFVSLVLAICALRIDDLAYWPKSGISFGWKNGQYDAIGLTKETTWCDAYEAERTPAQDSIFAGWTTQGLYLCWGGQTWLTCGICAILLIVLNAFCMICCPTPAFDCVLSLLTWLCSLAAVGVYAYEALYLALGCRDKGFITIPDTHGSEHFRQETLNSTGIRQYELNRSAHMNFGSTWPSDKQCEAGKSIKIMIAAIVLLLIELIVATTRCCGWCHEKHKQRYQKGAAPLAPAV